MTQEMSPPIAHKLLEGWRTTRLSSRAEGENMQRSGRRALRQATWLRVAAMFGGAIGLVALAPLANAQTPGHTPKASPRMVELIDGAERLPIEYRADIQLSAIESGRVLRGEWATEILQRLFRDAGTAKYAYKQKNVIGIPNLRSQKLDSAFGLNLDTLSIRTRVVRAMLRMAPAEARRLLEEVRVEVPPSPCTAPMVYDVSDFYVALEAVVNQAFTAKGREKGEHVTFIESQIRGIRSPVQLAPMAALIAKAEFGKADLERLTSDYSSVLQRAQATDRELSSLQRDQSLGKALSQLAGRQAQQPSVVIGLLRAYRIFLVKGARPAACGDFPADRKGVVEAFKRLLQECGAEESIATLVVEDLQPDRTAESAQIEPLPVPSEFGGLLGRLMERRQRRASQQTQSEESESSEWEMDVSDFLTKVDALDPAAAKCHACVFHEKADLLLIFYDFTPPGKLRARVLDHLVRFLATDTLQDESPLEWLFRVKLLLNLSRKPSEEQRRQIADLEKQGMMLTMLPSDTGPEILEAMRRSKNPVLYLYVSADELLKNEYVSPPYLTKPTNKD